MSTAIGSSDRGTLFKYTYNFYALKESTVVKQQSGWETVAYNDPQANQFAYNHESAWGGELNDQHIEWDTLTYRFVSKVPLTEPDFKRIKPFWDFTQTFNPEVQPSDEYCILLNVEPKKRLLMRALFGPNPQKFELVVCVYLAGTRLQPVINTGAIPNPVSFFWSSDLQVADFRQTFRVAGFWKDRLDGSWPFYAAVLLQNGGDGSTSWDGSFYHKQPGVFNDYMGDLHMWVG